MGIPAVGSREDSEREVAKECEEAGAFERNCVSVTTKDPLSPTLSPRTGRGSRVQAIALAGDPLLADAKRPGENPGRLTGCSDRLAYAQDS